jgi:Rrf2 family iron-sulfur cluster assembly transcriptional regulator
MQLSRRADYGIRLVLELSLLPDGGRTSTEEIARRQNLPVTFLSKIARQLAQSGVVRTYPGLGGGLQLGRSPDALTVLDVVEALEGPVAMARCTIDPNECPRSNLCPVHKMWKEVEDGITARLRSVTFAQLAQAEAEGRGLVSV